MPINRATEIALAIALGQGLLLWLLGRKAAHVGMSGVVFGDRCTASRGDSVEVAC